MELPEGWQFCRFSLVCWLNNGEKTIGEKLPYLDARTLRGKNEKTFLDNGIIVNEGEKVILVDGENSGEVFIVPYRGYMGSTFKILQIVSHINVEFIKIILDYYKDILKESKTGAAIPHLNKHLLKSIIIGVPPIDEQNRIVSQIQQIMQYIDLLENNQNDYADLVELLKKAILQSAIQGTLVEQDEKDEPASTLLEHIREEKRKQLGKKYIESYIFKGDDNRYYEKIGTKEPILLENLPFDIPSSWAWARLKDIVNIVSAKRVHQSDWMKQGIPFYRAREIAKLSEFGYVKNDLFISEELFNTYRVSGIPKENDLMVTAVGTIGKTYIVKENDTFYYKDASVICFENRYGIKALWLKILMDSPYMFKQIRAVATGTTVDTITIEKANNYLIPIPPKFEQEKICNKIKEIFQHIEKDES